MKEFGLIFFRMETHLILIDNEKDTDVISV